MSSQWRQPDLRAGCGDAGRVGPAPDGAADAVAGRVAGIVFGALDGCSPHDGVTPLDVVRDHLGDSPVPVAYGLAAGHSPAASEVVNMALPLGIRVRLDATGGRLAALEAAVV